VAQPFSAPCEAGVISAEPCPRELGREIPAPRRRIVLAACVLASSMAFIDSSVLTARLSSSAAVSAPIDYMLRRWNRFARFIDDGRICLTNNAAERALRGFALGRKSWLFAGSERGADRAAVMATLIMTAKLNDIDPQAWLADVLARIADHTIQDLDQLLPWNWESNPGKLAA
jgi:hypothetical protein